MPPPRGGGIFSKIEKYFKNLYLYLLEKIFFLFTKNRRRAAAAYFYYFCRLF